MRERCPIVGMRSVHVHPAHARHGREGNEGRRRVHYVRKAVTLTRQGYNRATLRSLVRDAGEHGRLTYLPLVHARNRYKARCLAIAQRDGAGLVQQQHIDIARRLHRTPTHRQHIALHQPVHARDTNGRKQAADGRRDQADQQGNQRRD